MESKSHILCIDDDDKIRELLEIFLHKHNFIVSTAKDAYEGQKISELFSFDLIILDIMMPKQSGLNFLINLEKLIQTFRLLCSQQTTNWKRKQSHTILVVMII